MNYKIKELVAEWQDRMQKVNYYSADCILFVRHLKLFFNDEYVEILERVLQRVDTSDHYDLYTDSRSSEIVKQYDNATIEVVKEFFNEALEEIEQDKQKEELAAREIDGSYQAKSERERNQ